MTIIVTLLIVLTILVALFFFTTLNHKSNSESQQDSLPPIKFFNVSEIEQISYYKGDVLNAVSDTSDDETRILIHICNNRGGWGAGFVLALSKKWAEPEQEYRECFKRRINYELGKIQPIKIKDNLYVINMIAQSGYKTAKNPTPLSYDALRECLNTVLIWIDENNFISPVIYAPKIGTGLAGGNWDTIKTILQEELTEIPIKIYEL